MKGKLGYRTVNNRSFSCAPTFITKSRCLKDLLLKLLKLFLFGAWLFLFNPPQRVCVVRNTIWLQVWSHIIRTFFLFIWMNDICSPLFIPAIFFTYGPHRRVYVLAYARQYVWKNSIFHFKRDDFYNIASWCFTLLNFFAYNNIHIICLNCNFNFQKSNALTSNVSLVIWSPRPATI